MTVTGELTKRATFSAPVKGRSPDGQRVIETSEELTVWAKLAPLRGGEAVMQSRLQAKSPAILTVRRSSSTRAITSEWAVTIDGRRYQLKEHPRETQDRAFLEMLVEAVS